MRWAFKIGYYSEGFFGYARQPGRPTVEGCLTEALLQRKVIEKTNRLPVASRTDRGVHALGNVIAFDTPLDGQRTARVLNAIDPRLFCFGYASVPEGFDPRRARERRYRYLLPGRNRDRALWKSWAEEFEGEHDFSSFSRTDTPPRATRRIVTEIALTWMEPYLALDITAPSFLWGQVRKIVAALELLEAGRLTLPGLKEALAGERRLTLPMAPAGRLILMDVLYPFSFTPVVPPSSSHQRILEENRIELELRATLLGLFREKVA